MADANQLRESHGRLPAVVHSRSSILIVLDAQGLVMLWNSGAAWTFGIAAPQTLGRPFTAVPIPWDWSRVERTAPGGVSREDRRLVQAFTRRDGSAGVVVMQVKPQFDPSGQLNGCLWLGSDSGQAALSLAPGIADAVRATRRDPPAPALPIGLTTTAAPASGQPPTAHPPPSWRVRTPLPFTAPGPVATPASSPPATPPTALPPTPSPGAPQAPRPLGDWRTRTPLPDGTGSTFTPTPTRGTVRTPLPVAPVSGSTFTPTPTRGTVRTPLPEAPNASSAYTPTPTRGTVRDPVVAYPIHVSFLDSHLQTLGEDLAEWRFLHVAESRLDEAGMEVSFTLSRRYPRDGFLKRRVLVASGELVGIYDP